MKKNLSDLKIKIYSDGADRASLLEMNSSDVVKGMTTNPSLMKKAGITDYPTFCKEILTQVREKPISFEVFADDISEMRRQALEIKTWGQNVFVKIPVINTKGESTLGLVSELTKQGIKLNITAIFSLNQVIQVAAALKGGAPSIVSVFAGRIADSGRDPKPMMRASVAVCEDAGKDIELLWASTREVFNLFEANDLGCHIITAPFDVIKKAIQMVGTTDEALCLDTVKTFKKDSEAAGFKL